MDSLLVLLFLDYASGGRDSFIRSILITVGIFMVIGGFLAHPLLGIFLLIVWAIYFPLAQTAKKKAERAEWEKRVDAIRQEQESRERLHFLEWGEHSEWYRGENPEWYAAVAKEHCEKEERRQRELESYPERHRRYVEAGCTDEAWDRFRNGG
jgi:hypothetical protein